MNQNNTKITTTASFSDALNHIKNNRGAARRNSWDPAIRIYITPGSHDFDTEPTLIHNIKGNLFQKGDSGTFTRLPEIHLSTLNLITLYNPSQEDILAEDWILY